MVDVVGVTAPLLQVEVLKGKQIEVFCEVFSSKQDNKGAAMKLL